MDCDEEDNSGVPLASVDDECRSAVNSLILDYYKKFGRKRDLEQYFSLSTAQSDIRDPSSVFWARMKTENESSDSGERSDKKSESSQELCRISIRFPAQEPYMCQEEESKAKTESVSPPIIIEEVTQDSSRQNSEDEANKSDDNNSQKSYDVLFDTSLNKPHSPSSSITSQRKLEWDSLADVGYANESDRKTSASSLSTLERLALKQQYSNNDTQDNNLGPPTAHSTPLDENEAKTKNKKGVGNKTTKIFKKDVDFLEVNVPHSSNMNPAQSINVNLTKHISFNVEKDGKITVENIQKDVSVSPEKIIAATELSPQFRIDKEIQTSLTKTKEINGPLIPANSQSQPQRIPILISLNTLRSRVRRKKIRIARRKLKSKKRSHKENIPVQEKSGDQPSEAESFEYMPGHIYNQNKLTANNRPPNPTDNKSSLESSRVATTESSKGSQHSFAKDLEKSIDVLKSALQQRCDDSALRKQLIKQVCQRLLKSKYRDDDSTTDFLSGLSYSSQKLGLGERNNTTTSTSDANNSTEKSKRPKKSILRSEKFNPGSIASTSQSVPNLPMASKSENPVRSNLVKNLSASNTESDISSKEKTSSDYGFAKTSAEELYKKYLQAYKREEAYKRHLKDKEMFLKQKLVSSDNALKVPLRTEVKPSSKLKDLINDLTRNNYDDGSGDAGKLEGGPGSNIDFDRFIPNRNQRSHSVFTLSSGNSDCNNKKPNLRKRLQCNIQDLSKPGPSKEQHYCCCPHHSGHLKLGGTDSSKQANINNPCSDATCALRQLPKQDKHEDSSIKAATAIADEATGQIKYVCLCSNKEAPENLLIYKCSRVTNKGIQIEEVPPKSSGEAYIQCCGQDCAKKNPDAKSISKDVTNKSSQTNMLMKMLHQSSSDPSMATCSDKKNEQNKLGVDKHSKEICPVCTVCEATRCVQTEISINPKISDPTLSDIVIMNENDCVKLISERRRELSKPSVSESKSCQPVEASAESAKSGSYKSSGTSKDVDIELLDEDNPMDVLDREHIENQKVNIEHSENYTIPIHGTNMTLMVSIGSERPIANNNKVQDTVNQNIGTDTVNIIEKATCLTEECSKSVQFNNADNYFKSIDHDNNNISDNYQSAARVIETVPIPNFDTYPKISPVNEHKPFRRCNTDTDKIGIQTDIIKMANVGTQEKVPTETQTENLSRKNIFCKCGCLKNKSICDEKCSYKKGTSTSSSNTKTSDASKQSSPRKSVKNLSVMAKDDTGISSKKDQQYDYTRRVNKALDKHTEKCSCGCGRTKNACKNTCPECKSSIGQQSKHSSVKGKGSVSCNKSDTSEKHGIKCPCGCEGTKDKCMQDCKELNPSTIEKTRNLGKGTCGKKSFANDQAETCTCGCGGSKNNCVENCEDLKSTPRDCKNSSLNKGDSELKLATNENRKSSLKKSQYDEITTNNESQKCLCGCSGTKNNCKEDCIELKSTTIKENKTQFEERKSCPTERKFSLDKDMCGNKDSDGKSEECHCGCNGTKNNCKLTCPELASLQKFDENSSGESQATPRENYRSPRQNNENSKERQRRSNENRKNSQDNSCTMSSNNRGDKCSCGCGGTKDNCKKDCDQLNHNTTPREQDKPSTNCRVYTAQQDFLNMRNDLCPCGCGDKKDNCGADCSKSDRSPRYVKDQMNKKEVGTQKHLKDDDESLRMSEKDYKNKPVNKVNSRGEHAHNRSLGKHQILSSEAEQTELESDPILDMIQNITKKYSKKNIEKGKRKKCFKEIMSLLNYLLETDESHNNQRKNMCESTSTADDTDSSIKKMPEKPANGKNISDKTPEKSSKKLVDKGIQLESKKFKPHPCMSESSELPASTDMPGTSSESNTCKVLNKIKKECERYHQKRCKIHSGKKCDPHCVTSVNCDHCRRVHHCPCRNHKCNKKSNEKINKSPVAYNLILQTSESVVSEGTVCGGKTRQLKNVIVKVPKKKSVCVPFGEMAAKFERNIHCSIPCPPCETRPCRSRSLPNETDFSSMEEIIRKSQGATVREYLEKNRPDFVERCSQRQSCLKYINESRCEDSARPNLKMIVVHTPNCTRSYKTHCGGVSNFPTTCISTQGLQPQILKTGVTRVANERAVKRDLLSLHLAQLPDVTDLESEDLRRLAKDLGRHMRQKQHAPKFISEREMKKHSEKIYKSLPEVVQKKEEKKKENIKKTNLLMAYIFKKNLQKKTLRGSVNLSNYSTVIKI